MSSVHCSTGWQYHGFDAIILENRALRVDILTGLGAKIYNLIDLATGRNLLWHNPRVPPRRPPFGASFDDWWAGGWDDPFPNGAATVFEGEHRPFLGELWTLPWQWEMSHDDNGGPCLHLWAEGVISPARMEKWVSLDSAAPVLHIRYAVTNLGYSPLTFMMGIHPALMVTPAHRIDLPATSVLVEESQAHRFGLPGHSYQWPYAEDDTGASVNLRQVLPASAGTYGFLYAYDLTDGWAGLTDTSGGPGLGLSFSREVFPVVWLWLVYGGWRGFYHVALEPWTSYPTRIDSAQAQGRTRVLPPGTVLTADLTAVVYRGWESVQHITMDGRVEGRRSRRREAHAFR